MLLQRSHYFLALVSNKNAPSPSPVWSEWRPHLPRRRATKTLAVVATSQETLRSNPLIEHAKPSRTNPPIEHAKQSRTSNVDANQSCLDSSTNVDATQSFLDRSTNVDAIQSCLDSSDVRIARPGLARVSMERFTMAERDDEHEGMYYSPKVGDRVIGTVVSGNFGKLDIEIGAKNLAYLFRKDAMPLDICNVRKRSWPIPPADSHSNAMAPPPPCDESHYVHDEEVLNSGAKVALIAEEGTVFVLEVKAITPNGVALLSARSVARGYAWQRVRQLHAHKAILKVQIIEWTPAGLVAKIEGLRAFLPSYNLLNRSPDSSAGETDFLKEYVGQILSVMITTVDELKSNLVVSEKKAWMTKNAYIGALVDGIITDIHPYGLHVRIKNTDLSGILHISNISRAQINNIECLFCVGEQVRAMIVPSNIKRKLSFSTADLELEDGLLLRDKQAVYRGAEEIAAEIARAYERRNPAADTNDDDVEEQVEQNIAIANFDWLSFDDRTCSDSNVPH